MRLVVFNGSPRGEKSNTRLLLEQFLGGFQQTGGNTFELFYLKRTAEQERFLAAFRDAEVVLLAFPLYVDAMPGLVKELIETLAPLRAGAGPPDAEGAARRPELGFLVQSGFPEAAHSRPVEEYNRKLARRLGCPYLGTIIKGGVEGIQARPARMNRRLYAALRSLGESFGRTGAFEPRTVKALARPERLSLAMQLLYRLLNLIGLAGFYWDWMLKKNGAYERRFARPYA